MKLPGIIGDNMVLQRGVEAPIWGWGQSGERITVVFRQHTLTAKADASGKWLVRLPAQDAGGPHEIQIRGEKSAPRTLRNVMFGEVWICSGQSNMEWPLSSTHFANLEAAGATFPNIRLIQIPRGGKEEPQDDVAASWTACDPKTVWGFSAVGYLFGRQLHQELGVPVGLIDSSLGGTPAEAWTSLPALRAVPELSPMIDQYHTAAKAVRELMSQNSERLWTLNGQVVWHDLSNEGEKMGWHQPAFADGDWRTMKLPTVWELTEAGDIDGAVWFRKTVEIPAAWADRDLVLRLGPIDDFDHTYFDGALVGRIDHNTPNFWVTPREYRIAGKLVKAGKAVIAVRVFDHIGNGGICGRPEQMELTCPEAPGAQPIRLAGEWRYKVELALPPLGSTGASTAPTVLFNSMINPLVPFAIRGAIWYQAESNGGRARQYRTLLPTMIRDWRARFGLGDFPFLIVQLPNWIEGPESIGQSNWAELREAQFLTTGAVENCALTVNTDIGTPTDIHPPNKQQYADRLARLARAMVYGHKIRCHGPLYLSMKAEGGRLRLSFAHSEDGLVTPGGQAARGFIIAGAEGKWVPAEARIDGASVVVSSPEVSKPTAVRYAWSCNPVEANLYNRAGLPMMPFRADIE